VRVSPYRADDDALEVDLTSVLAERARLDRRGATAREGGVHEEDRQRRGNGQRNRQADGVPSANHASSLASRLAHGRAEGFCDHAWSLSLALLRRNPVAALAALAAILVSASIALVFFWVPTEADQGFSQRIFYFHVPVALTAYACFAWGAWKAFRHLTRRQPGADLESYVAIHQGVIFGSLTLATGSLWAKVSWGHWWLWSENQLVLFLVLFLFYAAYFMLRFSLEPGPGRENMSAVYALFGVVLIPVSFLAIRLANQFIHPVVFTSRGPQMSTSMFVTFCVSLAAMLAVATALYRIELLGKRLDTRLRELREALA
jgi:heme exporter protein C